MGHDIAIADSVQSDKLVPKFVRDFVGSQNSPNPNGLVYDIDGLNLDVTLHYTGPVKDFPVNLAGGVGAMNPNGAMRDDERHLRGTTGGP